jgi:hypothetical protein
LRPRIDLEQRLRPSRLREGNLPPQGATERFLYDRIAMAIWDA